MPTLAGSSFSEFGYTGRTQGQPSSRTTRCKSRPSCAAPESGCPEQLLTKYLCSPLITDFYTARATSTVRSVEDRLANTGRTQGQPSSRTTRCKSRPSCAAPESGCPAIPGTDQIPLQSAHHGFLHCSSYFDCAVSRGPAGDTREKDSRQAAPRDVRVGRAALRPSRVVRQFQVGERRVSPPIAHCGSGCRTPYMES
jgi:hypothetical protein